MPATFLNDVLGLGYPEDHAISVFTTYNEQYFLDYIIYHGDPLDLKTIQMGFTQVIVHPIAGPRSDGVSSIPAQEIITGDVLESNEHYTGSKTGGMPGFLQHENYALHHLMFGLQLYGGDYPEPFSNIFYLQDAVGYLFVKPYADWMEQTTDAGLFFVQCT
ncbi:hypothetical protein DN757_05240 [Paenibacillus silvae]|uniref:DUF1963 domain-containing protein n=1 Tax=Paenibacillus silvae TaxID=1325358 RepID=A0A2W6PAW3_9BACL|nr:hypothetical protein DN757_05240 [Paenibacillus silvae]